MLAKELVPKIISKEYFSSQKKATKDNKAKVMVEYSQPNTHKEFHVGHGRNVSLGDSFVTSMNTLALRSLVQIT